MKTILYAIAFAVGTSKSVPAKGVVRDGWTARAVSASDVVLVEVQAFPADRREPLARVAVEWFGYESGYSMNPRGYNDKGDACGIGQVHSPHTYLKGATCDKVRTDLNLSVRVALVVIDRLWTQCGSLGGAMTAYSSNIGCPINGWVLPMVSFRCKEAGLTAQCKLKT